MSLFSDLFTVTAHVRPPDEELIRLNREATTAKKAKDWSLAISFLEAARERMRGAGVAFVPNDWLRLPLFLQQAGRFDEAMAEFEVLLQDTKSRVERELAHAGPYARRSSVASNLMRIYDKMRLACQREKRVDDVDHYADLYEQHRAIWVKLKPLARSEQKKKFENWEKTRK